jgi:hypothetical protein
MPTLPLYDPPTHPDGWHRVIGPGGYEWWHLAAEDKANGIRLGVNLIEGDPYNAAYMRAYRRYRRRPTRVSPPRPADYPCVRVNLSEKDELLWELVAPQPAGSLRASTGATDVALGPCVLRGSDDGTVRLSIEAPPLSRPVRASFHVDLTFRPLGTPPAGWMEIGTGESRVIYRHPETDLRYEVTGSLRELSGTEVRRLIEFRGEGEYEHTFATGPLHY